MAILLDSLAHSPSELGNAAWYRKITYNAIRNIVGPSLPFALYGFQENGGTGTTVSNEQGDAVADMTLNDAGMWAGAGWYTSYGRPGQAGMRGFGLRNDGGVSGYFGTVPDSPNININGLTSLTILFIMRKSATVENNPRIFSKRVPGGNAHEVFFEAASNDIAVYVNTNLGSAQVTFANSNFVTDHWHFGAVVLDASAPNDHVFYRDGILTDQANRGFSTLVDPGVSAYIGDLHNNLAALNGTIGMICVIPGLAMSQAQVQSLVELRGLFQPVAANRPSIIVPGHYGAPEYDFDGAATPNHDFMISYQIAPIKTEEGTIVIWYDVQDFVTPVTLFSLEEDATTNNEFLINLQMNIANDPVYLYYRTGGVTQWNGMLPGGSIIPYGNMLAITSDGTTTRALLNGVSQTITDAIGANSGQWFADVALANNFLFGCRTRSGTQVFGGQLTKALIYDRALTQLELQQIYSRGFGPGGPRFYPDH